MNTLMYSTNTLLAALSMKRSALYARMDDGTFPLPFKVGTKNYWSAVEIQAWVDEAAKGPRGLNDPTWRRKV